MLFRSMAASLPVVAVNDESFRNVVVEGLNGHLFETKKEYKGFVESFINEPSKLKQFSHQARINADTYSSKYFGERVLDVYNQAINNNGTKDEKKNVTSGFNKTVKGVLKWKKSS